MKSYKLGGDVIREEEIAGKTRRMWVGFKQSDYIKVHLVEYLGRAQLYNNVLIMRPWHDSFDDVKGWKDIDELIAWVDKLEQWDKSEFYVLQKAPEIGAQIWRCDGRNL